MTEDQRKHLELIQGVVSRLAGNSFTVKGWSVTAASALLALTATSSKGPLVIAVAALPSLVFWGLDAGFLRDERRYRDLYEQQATSAAAASQPAGAQGPSPLSLKLAKATCSEWWKAVWAPSVYLVHLGSIAAVLAFAFALWLQPPAPSAPPVVTTVRFDSASIDALRRGVPSTPAPAASTLPDARDSSARRGGGGRAGAPGTAPRGGKRGA